MSSFRMFGAAMVMACGFAVGAQACVMEDTGNPPWPTWSWSKSASPIAGFVRQELYMNVGLFPPATSTPCVCGFGYTGPTLPGINPLGMQVLTWDLATGTALTPVTAFGAMSFNPGTTAAFNDTGLYPAGAGVNWFGFGGVVTPFSPPVLPPGQQFVVCFQFDVPVALDNLFKQRIGCIAGGVGDENFVPIFQGNPHAVGVPFACVPIIPGPGAAAMLGLGGLIPLVHRRR